MNEVYSALARYYDCFTKNMEYEKRADYLCTLLSNAQVPQGCLVLDLACGTGNYCYALLERGYDVIGVDRSLEMLAVALEKAEQKNIAPPLLLCQSLEELDLYGTAKAAVCLTDSINHITQPAKLQRFFKRLSLFLEPGGVFLFDFNTQYKQEKILANNTFVYENEAAGAFCVWQNSWLPEERQTEIHMDLFTREGEGYRRSQEAFAQRVYAPAALERMLRRAGFRLEGIYDELTLLPLRTDSQRGFAVARRG
ncbi:MAG: methyltransferase domain-containing protein [Oscillospiraceae bacterium]|jgi:ubiquinone/menaquinone biosynthesis C-methylase UbiE|nr:methyltransferase domain-containing protein [Oscillospiraceae bacterium]